MSKTKFPKMNVHVESNDLPLGIKKPITCCICGGRICNRPDQFQVSGGYSIQIGEKLIVKDFCQECAKEIFTEIISRIEDEI